MNLKQKLIVRNLTLANANHSQPSIRYFHIINTKNENNINIINIQPARSFINHNTQRNNNNYYYISKIMIYTNGLPSNILLQMKHYAFSCVLYKVKNKCQW